MKLEVAGIYVINLDSRPERWGLFLEQAQSWETAFGKAPERFSAVAGVALPGYSQPPWFSDRISDKRKKSWGGKAGCILSHRNAILKAAKQRWNNVLLVEDDAFLTGEMVRAWSEGLRDLVTNLPEDWSAVYLCTTQPIPPCRIVGEYQGIKLAEAAGAFGTVAYLLNGRIFNRLIEELPNERTIWAWVARHKTIDRWFSRNLLRFGKVYFLAPSLAGHRTGDSDTSMSSENDWLLDFTLKDIRYMASGPAYSIQMALRRVSNASQAYFSILRQGVKRLRGL